MIDALTGRGQVTGKTLLARLAFGAEAVALFRGVLDHKKRNLDEWTELSIITTTDYARDGLTLCCLGHDATKYDSRERMCHFTIINGGA